MTAPLPPAYTSPTAGLFNALVRHLNRGYRARIADLHQQLSDAWEEQYALLGARRFAETEDAGYIDRTFLEKT